MQFDEALHIGFVHLRGQIGIIHPDFFPFEFLHIHTADTAFDDR